MRGKILIVEDEPAIADTLDYALRTEGFETHCVGLGRHALEALRADDFSVVILDVGLPDMSGFDVCRELRRESDVPVIFLTARSDEVDRIVGLELGADDYVPKPFSPREVASRVRAILRRARRPAAPAAAAQPRFKMDAERARIAYAGVWLALTRYEYRLLSTLLERPGPASSVMYVAAPVMRKGALIGVLTVAKPITALTPYDERAHDRVLRAGVALLLVSASIGLLFTLWLTRSLNRMRDYALSVANGEKIVPPTVGGGQLSDLARALALMRQRLDGKQYVESYVQGLTHEMKSPLSAVRGAAELLMENPSENDRRRFARNIGEQANRMQLIIDRLLLLARVEQLQAPEEVRDVDLAEVARQALAHRSEQMAARGLTAAAPGEASARVRGDPFLLQQAVGNLLDNAIDFSPHQGSIEVGLGSENGQCVLSVRDHGPGAPDFALPHLFERFYSLPRPATGRKSTGLGLAFAREVAKIHGGGVEFANAPDGGAVARLTLPR